MVAWARLGLAVLALRIGERGSEPRNVSSLERLEKIRKYILLWSLYKECSSADALLLVHFRSILDFGPPELKIINLCGFLSS